MQVDVQQVVMEHPFVRGMDPHHVKEMLACASPLELEAGEFLFKEGNDANASYLVQSGRVALEIFVPGKGPVQVESVGEGGVIGWSWIAAPYRWHFDARVVERARLVRIDGLAMRERCDASPDLGYAVMKAFMNLVQQRVESLRFQVLDVYQRQF